MTYYAHHIQLAREEGCTAVLRLALVRRVVLEELALILERSDDRLVRVNVALTTVDYRYVTQTERNDTACENIHNVRSGIPRRRVQLGGSYTEHWHRLT